MSTLSFDHSRRRTLALRPLVFSALLFATAAFLPAAASVPALLLGEAFAMAALAGMAGFSCLAGTRALLQRVAAHFFLLLAYAALLLLLTAYPLQWLLRERSLGATLAVSTEIVVALLCLWRVWPCFGLLFVAPRLRNATKSGDGLVPALRHAFVLAREVSANNELFFSHGLIVSAAILLLASAALALGFGETGLARSMHFAAVAAYALVLVPSAALIVLNRSAHALLIERRRQREQRGDRATAEPEPLVPAVPAPVPAELGRGELNVRLLRCARSGQTELAVAALAHGADPNAVPPADDRDQRSVLVLATLGADMRLLRHLIEKGADLNREHAGLTPLIAATRDSHQGRADAVMTLLTNGADPRCADADGNTPLHYAALSATPIVSALLCDAAAPVDALNRDGLTPLATACAAGNWTLARFLLDRGAKTEPARGQPALLSAASVADDDPTGVELLLRRKAKVDARDALGRSALMIAALHGNAAIAEALLDAGADVNLSDMRGTTALMEAARAGSLAVVELILSRNPALDACDATGRTALVIGCQSRQAGEDLVKRLVDAGASCEAGTDGKRAVDFAAAAGRWNLVAMLDPDYPLPASVADAASQPKVDPESPQHLLDALRFAHWPIVDEFSERVRTWPPEDLLRLHLALVDHQPATPRLWLIDHALQPLAASASGEQQLAALIERLPQSACAAAEWIAAGAPWGGVRLGAALGALATLEAAQRADLETLIEQAIGSGAEPFAADGDGRTPLASAVASGSARLVRALLERGVDANARDRHGRTPLFDALALPPEPARQIVPALIAHGADPEIAAANGETALGVALARPEADLRRWLNWPQWKPPRRALRGSDLPAAAAAGDLEAVEKLLDYGLPIGAVDAQGADALLRAAGCGHAALVRRLLERGADPQHAAPSGATALSAAVSARRDHAVAALLDHGIAADSRLPTGGTPLMVAAALGFAEIAERLLERGADANAQDERGTRALHAAAQFAFRSGETEPARRLIDALLRHGADVNAGNAAGQTPLLLLLGGRADPGTGADQKHLVALLPLFVLARADLDRQDQRGVGPLHACAMHGLLLPARALLAARADPTRRDVLDRTARQVAHLLGYVDVAVELGARESVTPLPDAGAS